MSPKEYRYTGEQWIFYDETFDEMKRRVEKEVKERYKTEAEERGDTQPLHCAKEGVKMPVMTTTDVKICRAILHTAHLTKEYLAEQWGDDATPEELDNSVQVYAAMDGHEAILKPYVFSDDNEYSFISMANEDKDREVSYLLEQNPMFGCFIDQRNEFDEAYASGEYTRDVGFLLDNSTVELIETSIEE